MSGVPALARSASAADAGAVFPLRPAVGRALAIELHEHVGPETALLSPPLLCRLPRNLRASLRRHGFSALSAALAA
jgi:hypothetical protein